MTAQRELPPRLTTSVPRQVPLTASVVRRNLSAVGVSYVLGSIAGFATQSVLGRTFGSSTYGVYAAALAIAMTLNVVQEIAGPAWLVRTASQRSDRYGELSGAVVALRLLLGVAVIVGSVSVATGLGMGRQGIVATALLASVAGLNAVLRALRSGFQLAERMPTASVIATANSVGTALVMIALVWAGSGLIAALAGSVVVSALLIPFTWWRLDAFLRPRLHVRLPVLQSAVTQSMPFTVVAALAVVLSYADTLVIRVALGNDATGLYGAAWRLLTVLQWVPAIVVDSVFRGMAAMAVDDRARLHQLVDRAAAGLALIALPMAVAGSLLARPLFVVVFGRHFGAGAEAFRILLWSLPLTYPAWIVTEALLVGRRASRVGWLLGTAVVGNVAANIVLVPRYGINAAAWINLGTELLVVVTAVLLLWHDGIAPRWPVALLPGLLLTGIVLAAVVPLRSMPLAVPLMTGTAAYAVAAFIAWRLCRTTRWMSRALVVFSGGDR